MNEHDPYECAAYYAAQIETSQRVLRALFVLLFVVIVTAAFSV